MNYLHNTEKCIIFALNLIINNMNLNKKISDFKNLVIESEILKDKNPIIDGNGNIVNAIFTTSQEMDVKEMIIDGMSYDDMLNIVKQW
jgi:hypothetical protein